MRFKEQYADYEFRYALKDVSAPEERTAHAIAERVGTSYATAARRLKCMYERGELHRERVSGSKNRTYVYSIPGSPLHF